MAMKELPWVSRQQEAVFDRMMGDSADLVAERLAPLDNPTFHVILVLNPETVNQLWVSGKQERHTCHQLLRWLRHVVLMRKS